jgi:hypothetical protein
LEANIMMVQKSLPGEPNFVCTMAEHNDLCGQFARAFGNDQFEPLDPLEEMIYVVSHHDYGWNDWDAAPMLDPATRLPAGIAATPSSVSIASNKRSPEINESHHPYCGLLASMHSWGLFNERYGLSDFSVRPGGSKSVPIPKDNTDVADDFLDGEKARQNRLRILLAEHPETADLVDENHLFQNYKQLQFFDTLALYFNLRHESERGEEVFTHVPRTATEDASVRVTPCGDGVYSFDPFPFRGNELEVVCAGRYVHPFPENEELTPDQIGAALRGLPATDQTYSFVPA